MRNVICQHEILTSGSRSLAKGRHAIRRTCAALDIIPQFARLLAMAQKKKGRSQLDFRTQKDKEKPMPRTEEQTRALFNDWAESYDTDLIEADGPLLGYAQSLRAMDDALPIERGWQVLDIGIGSGALARKLADRGAQITGIDLSDRMLALCRKHNPDFELCGGTFNNIPFPAATFDCIVSSFALHETPPAKRGVACAEMARVLKPGGGLYLLDIMFASDLATQEARQIVGTKWDDDEDYAIVGDLDTLLRQNGFSAVRWSQTVSFHWMVAARKGLALV